MNRWSALLSVVLLGVPVLAAGAAAEELPYLSDYVGQVGFLPGSPGTAGMAVSGLVNPAAPGMLPGGEVQFFWSEPEKKFGIPEVWSLVFGGLPLGFGVTHWSWKGESTVLPASPGGGIARAGHMTDYTLSLSTGDRKSAAGIAYQWSQGEAWDRRDDSALLLGSLWRPVPQVSVGAAAAYTFGKNDQRYVVDGGVRPFGTPLLMLFGEAVCYNDQDLGDALWSAGLSSEFLPGVSVYGKTRKDDSYSIGLGVSLGTFGVSAHPDFDKNGDLVRTTYGFRAGWRRPSLADPMASKGKAYYSLDMRGSTRYRRFRMFDDEGHTLRELLDELEEVRTRDLYAGVVLNLSSMQASPALRWEVRQKLEEIRKAGKRIVVYLDYAQIGEYYLASVADEIVIDPEGAMMLLGMGMSRTYMRGTLDKLGIGIDEWRFFKYKSAAEGLSRKDMSEGDREQRQALLDGFYSEIREGICDSRGFRPAFFDSVVNHVVILQADDAVAMNFADSQGRWADVGDKVKELEKQGKRLVGRTQMELLKPRPDTWGRPPRVAIIYGLGECAMDTGIAARRLGGVIRAARENTDIRAVVFRADSPGGEIIPSDIVAQELKKTAERKPVIVSQGYVAGSGGYWISMNGQKILATPFTITGSIGVIGLWMYNDGFGDRIGFTSDHVQVGDHADAFLGIQVPLLGTLPSRNLTAFERTRVEDEIRLSYDHFITKVAASRKMTKEEVHEVGQGRVWTGRDGLEKGLVDEIGGLELAIARAKEAAGIPAGEEIELVELPRMPLLNPGLFKIPSPIRATDGMTDLDYLRLVARANGRPIALMPPDLIVEP